MPRYFAPLAVVTGIMFVLSPVLIANAPYESTMGLVQKIFYYHVPSWFAMFTGALVCGVASARFLFAKRQESDHTAVAAAELTVLFGLIGLVTGPLWARKAWGVWWQWDAKLTTALVAWMIFIAYLLVRRYGGPGSEKLAAAVGIFGAANIPFVYVAAHVWRTVHPTTNVVPTLGAGMRGAFWFCALAFWLLFLLMLSLRVHLERQRARVEQLYLATDE